MNHGGCLFKVYVVGGVVTSTIRRSLPRFCGAKKSSRRRAKASALANARLAAAAAKDTATRQGAKLARGRASEGDGTGGSPERAGDDGYDQDESGGEGESEDGESGLYSFTGAQQIPRVSCFRGSSRR